LETNLSSYLIKPFSASWEDGCTSLEGKFGSTRGPSRRGGGGQARPVRSGLSRLGSRGCLLAGGSTIGAIARLVEDSPASFTGFGLKIGVDERDRLNAKGRPKKKVQIGPGREGGGRAAGRVWDMVK